jgi:hypothetical protein
MNPIELLFTLVALLWVVTVGCGVVVVGFIGKAIYHQIKGE